MHKGRLEAFSDGVFAIIITIMVLELRPPHVASLAALKSLAPIFLSYALSFVFVGIYWNNHHHLLQVAKGVSGAALWANLHLLFWLSLIPFATEWMGDSAFAPGPVALYGGVLVLCAAAFTVLTVILAKREGPHSALARALGRDIKGKASLAIYLACLPVALLAPKVALGGYVLVALIWFVPDRRMERALASLER